jgi:hypothetical protein
MQIGSKSEFTGNCWCERKKITVFSTCHVTCHMLCSEHSIVMMVHFLVMVSKSLWTWIICLARSRCIIGWICQHCILCLFRSVHSPWKQHVFSFEIALLVRIYVTAFNSVSTFLCKKGMLTGVNQQLLPDVANCFE